MITFNTSSAHITTKLTLDSQEIVPVLHALELTGRNKNTTGLDNLNLNTDMNTNLNVNLNMNNNSNGNVGNVSRLSAVTSAYKNLGYNLKSVRKVKGYIDFYFEVVFIKTLKNGDKWIVTKFVNKHSILTYTDFKKAA